MTYDLPTWENSPSTDTPLNATNLNKYTTSVDDLDARVGDLDSRVGTLESEVVNSVTAGDSSITIGGTASAPTVAVDQANLTLAESQVTNLTSDLAGKVSTSRSVTAGTGLTGGGALSSNVTLSVVYGTSAGTAAQGNDSRLSDSRTPTGTAGGVLTGSYPNPGLDAVPFTPAALTYASTVTADPTVSNNFNLTATGNCTIGVSSTGAVDGQMVVIAVKASSAITVTPATGTIGAQSISSGAVGFFGFRYTTLLSTPAFVCIAYQASS